MNRAGCLALDQFGAALVVWMNEGTPIPRVAEPDETTRWPSAAMLAWRHYFPDDQPPPLFAYLEDAALDSWQLPMSREVSAALASLPRQFAAWHDLLFGWEDHGFPLLSTEGRGILRLQGQLAMQVA